MAPNVVKWLALDENVPDHSRVYLKLSISIISNGCYTKLYDVTIALA